MVGKVEVRRIPLPAAAAARAQERAGSAAALADAFVKATTSLPVEVAAALAAVRPETLRKWRRRVPRWLKAETARRLQAYLAGEAPAAPRSDEGLLRAFRPRLREAPVE